jgi:hypothetical protein
MRLRGRVTAYGEYLMHDVAEGYCFPAPYWMTTERPHKDTANSYRGELDNIARTLRGLGYGPRELFGNLPLGAGFAGSTVLAILHLWGRTSECKLRKTVNMLDHYSHGLSPSGLDSTAILAQSPGFYMAGRWRPAPQWTESTLFFVPREPKTLELRDVARRVRKHELDLTRIARHLTEYMEKRGRADLAAMFDYCSILLRSGVYTSEQVDVIADCLGAGLAAKGIGGLHGKAVVMLGSVAQLALAKQRLINYQPTIDLLCDS